MATIEIDDQTATAIRLAADTADITPGEVIRRLVDRSRPSSGAMKTQAAESEKVPIHAVYEGHRTAGTYEVATHRVTITDGPLTSRSFKSPSGAAIAVVTHYQPGVNPNRNGWTFWTVTNSGDLLQSLRHRR
jgi:hypothetical protein